MFIITAKNILFGFYVKIDITKTHKINLSQILYKPPFYKSNNKRKQNTGLWRRKKTNTAEPTVNTKSNNIQHETSEFPVLTPETLPTAD
jgi:hypothetical protein